MNEVERRILDASLERLAGDISAHPGVTAEMEKANDIFYVDHLLANGQGKMAVVWLSEDDPDPKLMFQVMDDTGDNADIPIEIKTHQVECEGCRRNLARMIAASIAPIDMPL